MGYLSQRSFSIDLGVRRERLEGFGASGALALTLVLTFGFSLSRLRLVCRMPRPADIRFETTGFRDR